MLPNGRKVVAVEIPRRPMWKEAIIANFKVSSHILRSD
jgi:hypothetical protein